MTICYPCLKHHVDIVQLLSKSDSVKCWLWRIFSLMQLFPEKKCRYFIVVAWRSRCCSKSQSGLLSILWKNSHLRCNDALSIPLNLLMSTILLAQSFWAKSTIETPLFSHDFFLIFSFCSHLWVWTTEIDGIRQTTCPKIIRLSIRFTFTA